MDEPDKKNNLPRLLIGQSENQDHLRLLSGKLGLAKRTDFGKTEEECLSKAGDSITKWLIFHAQQTAEDTTTHEGKHQPIRLFLIDVQMNGSIKAIENVKECYKKVNLAINGTQIIEPRYVMLTEFSTAELVSTGQRLGVYQIVSKPITLEMLRSLF
jgi:DNA-binding NarL/FixJ family response regulator